MNDLLDVEAAREAVDKLLTQLKVSQPLTSIGIGREEYQLTLVVYVREESHITELPEQVDGFKVDPHVIGEVSAL